ncbi:MAG: polyphenol oxidase family protein, partial [Burkholderiaceae bacterium]
MSLPVLEMNWPERPASVSVISTTRRGGYSATPYDDGTGAGGLNLGTHVGDVAETVARNRALLRQALPAEPIWLTQVHGTRVVNADVADVTSAFIEADACITTRTDVVCAIMTADCMPVLLADSRGRVVGAAHAGWRGLAGGVLQATVNAMRDCGADNIVAWLGPGIGPHAFEVGSDVLAAFKSSQPELTAFRP